jgi:hypothetical protein
LTIERMEFLSTYLITIPNGIGLAVGFGIYLLARWRGVRSRWLALAPTVCGLIGVAVSLGAFLGVVPSRAQQDALAQLDQLPSVRAMKADYPEDYDQLKSMVHDGLGRSPSQQEIQFEVRMADAVLLAKQTAKLNPDNAYDAFALVRDEAASFRGRSPGSCAGVIYGARSKFDPSIGLSPALFDREQEVTTRLLVQAAKSPAAASPSAADDTVFGRITAQALAAIPSAERSVAKDLLSSGRQPLSSDEDRTMCDFWVEWLRLALSQPKPVAVSLAASLRDDK